MPNPGKTARTFLPPCHTVRKQQEEQEYQAMRAEFQKEHAKNFRYVLKRYHRMGRKERRQKKLRSVLFCRETLMQVEWLPYLDASLSIFRFYMFVERNVLIDVDMLRDLDLPLSVKVDFLNFSFALGLLEF